MLLTKQTQDTSNLRCLLQVDNQTFLVNVTISPNPFVIRCIVPTAAMAKTPSLGLGLLYLNEVVAYHQACFVFQQLKVLSKPRI